MAIVGASSPKASADRAVGAQRRRRRRHDAVLDGRPGRRARAARTSCAAPTPSSSRRRPLGARHRGDGRPVRRRRRRPRGHVAAACGSTRRSASRQAQLPFGKMLADMETTDVHPPLHHAILWVTVRALRHVRVRRAAAVADRRRRPRAGDVLGRASVALRPPHRLDRRRAGDDRPVLRLVLAGSAHVLAVHAVRRRSPSAPRCSPCAAAAGTTGRCTRVVDGAAVLDAVLRRPADRSSSRSASPGGRGRPASDRHEWRRCVRGLAASALAVVAVLVAAAAPDPARPVRRLRQPRRRARRRARPAPAARRSAARSRSTRSAPTSSGPSLGYHADGVMVQIAALWPLLMLLAFVMLGRGRAGPSLLLLGARRRPDDGAVRVGSLKRDLFELRYFCGAVPALLLLAARVVTSTTVRRRGRRLLGAAVARRGAGRRPRRPAAQRRQPAPLRLRGRARPRSSRAPSPATSCCTSPTYLADVVDYYAPGADAPRPVGTAVPAGTARCGCSPPSGCIDAEDTSARLGDELAVLERQLDIVDALRPSQRPRVGACDETSHSIRRLPRLEPPTWDAATAGRGRARSGRTLARRSPARSRSSSTSAGCCSPSRVGNPVLFGAARRRRAVQRRPGGRLLVDVPGRTATSRGPSPARSPHRPTSTCSSRPTDEPVEVVEATVAAAIAAARRRVHVAPARRRQPRRDGRAGPPPRRALRPSHAPRAAPRRATSTTPSAARDAPFVARPRLRPRPAPATCSSDARPSSPTTRVAYVQTPQYYANAGDEPRSPAAAWSQQALFFGPIARGKDAHDAMFCCGTNVVFRRARARGGRRLPARTRSPRTSSCRSSLHERGWRSAYVPEVLASGLGPEDLASYVSQQHRWARGCRRRSSAACCAADAAAAAASCSTCCRRRTSSPGGRCSSTCRCRSCGSSPAPSRSPVPPPTASSPRFAPVLRPRRWRRSPASAPGTYTFARLRAGDVDVLDPRPRDADRVLRRRAGSFVVTPKQGAAGRQLAPGGARPWP